MQRFIIEFFFQKTSSHKNLNRKFEYNAILPNFQVKTVVYGSVLKNFRLAAPLSPIIYFCDTLCNLNRESRKFGDALRKCGEKPLISFESSLKMLS